ncbi:TetR/AcrR family transcriptional regulator [Isoptericola sp. NEAU-Y5]|uniref:TetR/AcrR family transcriptional regulator n=1 Tax=Isoptericola luteus TaxID=2879484 RepID=A0ABS7ZBI2_9MICO|nr:TetR/AcrR family transcriptional regulator [Isoptericola sp. NEAU-Y5]MCA5892411.1 TetR/AcrR family transcriptional regulator [Isoptericola sp. NEAU-Y5]
MGAEDAVDAHVRRLWRHRGAEPAGPRRGPRPRLTVDEVLDAAVEVADAQGLGGLSTRAVATRLGLSAMALYPYVGTKEHLLALAEDHASPLPPWPDRASSLADDLTTWGEHLLDLYARHPWLAELPWADAAGGPNQQDWLERLLEILERWDARPESRAAVVTALYAVVRAAAQTSASYARAGASGDDRAWLARADATRRVVGDLAERYPLAAALPQHAAQDWRDAPRASVRHVAEVLGRGLEATGVRSPG